MKKALIAMGIVTVLSLGVAIGVSIPEANAGFSPRSPMGVANNWECPTEKTCFFFSGEKFFTLQRRSLDSSWRLQEVRPEKPKKSSSLAAGVSMFEALE